MSSQSGIQSNMQQNRGQPPQQSSYFDKIDKKLHQTRDMLKWMQDMLMQIRKDLEWVGFRCIYEIYNECWKIENQLPQNQIVQMQYSNTISHMYNLTQFFLNLDIKDLIDKLLKYLVNKNQRDSEKDKIMQIKQKYDEIYISLYSYECIVCYFNENQVTQDFCRDIFQRFIKKRIPQAFNKNQSIPSLQNNDYQFHISKDKEDNERERNFLTNFDDINLFHKLEVVKKDKVKTSEIQVFQKAYEYLDQLNSNNNNEVKPKCNLVYSVLEKSLMVNDFLERKHIESDSQHPSILKMRIDDPNESVTCIEVSKSGNVIMCGTQDSQIYLFDVGKFQNTNSSNQSDIIFGEENQEQYNSNSVQIKFRSKFIGHEDAITSISILYNENYFISASIDLSIRLWDVRLNVCLNIYKGHLNTIWNVKFARQGYIFGSCSADKTAMLWTTNRPQIAKVLIGHQKDVTQIDFAENLEYVITASLDNKIKFWELKTGVCALTLELNSPVTCMHMSYSGYYFITGQDNGDIRLWDLHNLKLVQSVNLQSLKSRDPIYSVHISFDESTITVNTSKYLAYYNINQLNQIQGQHLYEEFDIGKEKYNQKIEFNRFTPIEPKEIFELPKIQTEKFIKSYMHMRNFILAISKQTI
ncbi:hypothetical protein ABPG74_007750 [Tetrahymena malaccensis]